MSRRIIVFCTLALLAAIVFVRLGLWQLDRLRERRGFNATIVRQQLGAPIPLVDLPRDTARAHYRSASVEGTYDYQHELVLSTRTRRGSPGVDLLTPVRIAARDTAPAHAAGFDRDRQCADLRVSVRDARRLEHHRAHAADGVRSRARAAEPVRAGGQGSFFCNYKK